MMTEEKIVEIHKHILYPVVRVRTDKAGGSGVIIYSKPTPDNPEAYETYVATCNHVIEDAVKFVKKWSPIAQREITIEDRQLVQVEVFKYEKLSRCVGGTTYQAEYQNASTTADKLNVLAKYVKMLSFVIWYLLQLEVEGR
jgi:hypothetical protein